MNKRNIISDILWFATGFVIASGCYLAGYQKGKDVQEERDNAELRKFYGQED